MRHHLTVDRILDEYLAFKKQEHSLRKLPKKNYDALEYALLHIRPFFGYLHAKQITPKLGRKYTAERAALGRSPATIGKELSILNAAINLAFKEGLIDKAYTVQLPPPPPPRDKWMQEGQVIDFVSSIKTQHIYVFAMLALHTLSRKTSILELTWDRVDFKHLTIDYNQPGRTITKKRRPVVPINGLLLECLLEAKSIAGTDYVVEYNGAAVADCKKAFERAAEAVGMGWVTPHVLRHTGATLMAKDGVALWDIAGMMGDSIQTVTKHYAKHHPDYLVKAGESLERLYKR